MFNKKALIIILASLLFASLVSNILIYKHFQKNDESKFSLLAPGIAWIEAGEFRKMQNQYSIQYQGLKNELTAITQNPGVQGEYGIYFEDLNTGAWVGINEREEFVPASLLKVPVMVAILKKVERGEVDLDQKIALNAEDLDLKSGTLGLKGPGYEITVQELLVYLIKESDNTAVLTLHHQLLTDEEVMEAKLAMGLPIDNAQNYDAIGPKHYSNIFRSLYYSAYLHRTFSELGLSIMSETDYDTQLPAGIPEDVQISHKIGFYYTTSGNAGYHDCGIVYYPEKPYILCVMSRNTNKAEADRIISTISRTTYNYVNKYFHE